MKKQTCKISLGEISKRNKLSLPKMRVYDIGEMTNMQLLLYTACREGDATSIRDCLREDDLYTNIIDCTRKRTLIHYTAENNLSLSTALLIHKLKKEGFRKIRSILNHQDVDGNTPLHLVLLNDTPDEKLIKSLVTNGADIYLKNNENKSCLNLAKQTNYVEIIDYFSRLDKKLNKIVPKKQSKLDNWIKKL